MLIYKKKLTNCGIFILLLNQKINKKIQIEKGYN